MGYTQINLIKKQSDPFLSPSRWYLKMTILSFLTKMAKNTKKRQK